MFRLIKLAAYALFGIAAYELIMGMMEGPAAPRSQRAGGGGAPRAGEGGSRSSRLRGSASVPVEGSDGASHRQRVGRGIVAS